ncbi:MAG: class I SAM-dependent methyltransferase [Ruminococcus sp.]|nr:class I SAM-dependent methyltransferase [Ruminococcus sp.]
MIWDKMAGVYDIFENVYNGKVYSMTGKTVAKEIDRNDIVLECACGTGAVSVYIAPECRKLIATDISPGMLRHTARKTKGFSSVIVRRADMTHLNCRSNSFDKVVAGNVIHLLDDPEAAVRELMRVCKPGGKVIIPTYINNEGTQQRRAVSLIKMLGVDFKRQFDLKTYKEFFLNAGYSDAVYHVVSGRMPCAVAVITKQTTASPSCGNDVIKEEGKL